MDLTLKKPFKSHRGCFFRILIFLKHFFGYPISLCESLQGLNWLLIHFRLFNTESNSPVTFQPGSHMCPIKTLCSDPPPDSQPWTLPGKHSSCYSGPIYPFLRTSNLASPTHSHITLYCKWTLLFRANIGSWNHWAKSTEVPIYPLLAHTHISPTIDIAPPAPYVCYLWRAYVTRYCHPKSIVSWCFALSVHSVGCDRCIRTCIHH